MPERDSMCWTVSFDRAHALETLAVTGVGCEIRAGSNGKDVVIRLPYGAEKLLEIRPGMTRIYGGSAVLPVFARVRGNRVELSNRAAELMSAGETIGIKTQVLVQQLLGANYPQHGMFTDIELLEVNAIYTPAEGALRYDRTTLTEGNTAEAADILDLICEGYESVFASGRPICVLVSGGYDSRFNLALARQLSRRYGNEVHAFHEFKDEAEYTITKQVAAAAGVPLHTETRQAFSAQVETEIFDRDFISFHSGTYRHNIPRWHAYLRDILSRVEGGVVLGLGAEPHKGKFYGQVHDLRCDGERAFGASVGRIDQAARSLGITAFDRDTQGDFFDTLTRRASAFDDHFARIDFLHYHTYVINGYGHRCFDFQQHFDLPFPLLEHRFLTAIFAMPAAAKRDFRIVKEGIARLAPELAAIPFLSGNAKALKIRRPGERSLRERFPPLAALKDLVAPARKKGELSRTVAARVETLSEKPASDITARLLDCLRHDRNVGVRLDYALQAFLYFRALEVDKGVTLRCA